MKIYKLIHNSEFFWSVKLDNTLLLEKIVDGFYNNGTSFDIDFGKYEWQKNEGETICDFPFISGNIPLLSSKAFEVLEPFVSKSKVEIIPIIIEADTFYLLHFLETFDVLNLKASKISYFKDKTIQSIDKYVFLPEVTEVTPFFMIPQLKTFVFVREEVKNIIIKHNLVGLDFQECDVKKKSLFSF